jgi:hypothetical protein
VFKAFGRDPTRTLVSNHPPVATIVCFRGVFPILASLAGTTPPDVDFGETPSPQALKGVSFAALRKPDAESAVRKLEELRKFD